VNPIKKQARIAGLLYTLVAVTGPVSLVYIPGKLFVAGDAVGAADRIRASESLLRLGIASELFYQTIEVFLVLVLYELFKDVNKPLARQMAVLGLLPIPIVFLNVLNEIAALTLVSGANFLAVIGPKQLGALATLFVALHGQGLQLAEIFWGLWLFPFGLLIIRCGFIPKALGVLVLIAGTGYLISASVSLMVPYYASHVGIFTGVLELGEPAIILWLLIWGAKGQPSNSLFASAR
jgi:Domain of unknown function (DUF4386)